MARFVCLLDPIWESFQFQFFRQYLLIYFFLLCCQTCLQLFYFFIFYLFIYLFFCFLYVSLSLLVCFDVAVSLFVSLSLFPIQVFYSCSNSFGGCIFYHWLYFLSYRLTRSILWCCLLGYISIMYSYFRSLFFPILIPSVHLWFFLFILLFFCLLVLRLMLCCWVLWGFGFQYLVFQLE